MNKRKKFKERVKKEKWRYILKYGFFYFGIIGATIILIFQKLIFDIQLTP
ncbi:MAG: hypothetical protein KKB79_02950 [Nanoarchaeota archaeon]|nr:hypothetical protein [Nanoarchaeota archaeon]